MTHKRVLSGLCVDRGCSGVPEPSIEKEMVSERGCGRFSVACLGLLYLVGIHPTAQVIKAAACPSSSTGDLMDSFR